MILPVLLGWKALQCEPSCPLNEAVSGPYYRQLVGMGLAQILTQIWYSHNLRLTDFYRTFCYMISAAFFSLNLAMIYYPKDDSAEAAKLFLALWGCAKMGGTAIVFSYAVSAKRMAKPGLIAGAVIGFAFTCCSVICEAYASHLMEWKDGLVRARYIFLASWMGILIKLMFSAFDMSSVKFTGTNNDMHRFLKLAMHAAFLMTYFAMNPHGVSYNSNENEILRLVIYYMLFFVFDSFETTNIGQRIESQQTILAKIFPPYVASQFQRQNASVKNVFVPRVHLNATVFFSDIVSFVELSEELGPLESMRVLDELFGVMDRCATKCGVYKVETIGDAYSKLLTYFYGASPHISSYLLSLFLLLYRSGGGN